MGARWEKATDTRTVVPHSRRLPPKPGCTEGMWAASLGRGPKLNEIQISEDGEVLERQRREWLRRLEVPHGRSASSMPRAVWEPAEKLARVTRDGLWR